MVSSVGGYAGADLGGLLGLQTPPPPPPQKIIPTQLYARQPDIVAAMISSVLWYVVYSKHRVIYCKPHHTVLDNFNIVL